MQVKCNKLDIIQLVLADNADINQRDKYGRTSLHYAACNATYDVIQFLIDRNGDCNIKIMMD